MKYEGKSLLDVKIEDVSVKEIRHLIASGVIKVTPAGLYSPEHAPKGSRFLRVPSGRIYRITSVIK